MGKRKEAKELHRRQKKRLKRQWKKVKEKKVLQVSLAVTNDEKPDEARLEKLTASLADLKSHRELENTKYEGQSEKLWLSDCTEVRSSATRDLMGWVTRGGYCYRKGGEVGTGLVTLRGYIAWLNRFKYEASHRFVLVREPTSLQYRRAKMSIIC